jgi:D-alanyl-D-alanine carboxypeptidase
MRLFLATLGAVSVLLAGTVGSADAQTTTPAQRTLQRALTKSLRQAGRQSGAYVVDLTTGQVLFSQAANAGRLPASVEVV